MWNYSCLHGLSQPQRTHAAVRGFVLCSAVNSILPLQTLTTKHKPKPEMIVSLDPMILKKTCGVDLEALTVFSDGITKIDSSNEHKS